MEAVLLINRGCPRGLAQLFGGHLFTQYATHRGQAGWQSSLTGGTPVFYQKTPNCQYFLLHKSATEEAPHRIGRSRGCIGAMQSCAQSGHPCLSVC
jgi:hypothetical protein